MVADISGPPMPISAFKPIKSSKNTRMPRANLKETGTKLIV